MSQHHPNCVRDALRSALTCPENLQDDLRTLCANWEITKMLKIHVRWYWYVYRTGRCE